MVMRSKIGSEIPFEEKQDYGLLPVSGRRLATTGSDARWASDGTSQFDDITMMCIKYHEPRAESRTGPVGCKMGDNSKMREITVDADLNQIKPVTDFVNALLTELRCTEQIQIQVKVAIDEMLSNIARYAYTQGSGEAIVQVEIEEDPRCLILTFIDRGIPFNPLTGTMPDTTKMPVRERPIGGLGLYMIKKMMDGIDYKYRDGKNIVIIRKRI